MYTHTCTHTHTHTHTQDKTETPSSDGYSANLSALQWFQLCAFVFAVWYAWRPLVFKKQSGPLSLYSKSHMAQFLDSPSTHSKPVTPRPHKRFNFDSNNSYNSYDGTDVNRHSNRIHNHNNTNTNNANNTNNNNNNNEKDRVGRPAIRTNNFVGPVPSWHTHTRTHTHTHNWSFFVLCV